jgi:hypothetical protein
MRRSAMFALMTFVLPAHADDGKLTGQAAVDLRQELERTSEIGSCEWSTGADSIEEYEARSYDLGDGGTLYLVRCERGPWGEDTVVFVRGIDVPELLAFPGYTKEAGWFGTTHLGRVEFDPKTGALTDFFQFRNSGDCGRRVRYQWTKGLGFKLMEYRYEECVGDEPVEKANVEFPVIYQSTN